MPIAPFLMPIIVEEVAYDGALAKIERLGLSSLLQEVREILTGFRLEVLEKRNGNGGAAVREMIDAAFDATNTRPDSTIKWVKTVSGDVDWRKCRHIEGIRLCLGVEVQVSARSDMLVMDVVHLRRALETGEIDVAVLIVPSDRLSVFLTDRAPDVSSARRHVHAARAEDLPILLLAIQHDGPGPALAKRRTRQGRLDQDDQRE
jgi:hypothetical protein